jgi:hypothetical protein
MFDTLWRLCQRKPVDVEQSVPRAIALHEIITAISYLIHALLTDTLDEFMVIGLLTMIAMAFKTLWR